MSLGYYKKALKAFERAIEIDPFYGEAYNNKGDALYKLGRYQEASIAYKNALRMDADYSTLNKNQA